MQRVVEPEMLDELPAENPAAVRSRRDLRRLNRVMGHARALCEMLAAGMGSRPVKRLVDLGAGDGQLALGLARRLSKKWRGAEVILVDRQPAVSRDTLAAFEALGWRANAVCADVFDWLRDAGGELVDAMTANLFLHHFPDAQLAELLKLAAARTRVFAACEPRRGTLPLALSRLVGLIGCNAVTRHDAVVSVKAGFAGNEISALWPAAPDWELQERGRRFSHAFLAGRTS